MCHIYKYLFGITGISRDHWHKRRATGGKRKPLRKKRKFELGRPAANTKLGTQRIHTVLLNNPLSWNSIFYLSLSEAKDSCFMNVIIYQKQSIINLLIYIIYYAIYSLLKSIKVFLYKDIWFPFLLTISVAI